MWYVIQVLTGDEERVSKRCRNALVPETFREVFVPRYLCMKRYQGKWHEEMRVLFPGYFFVDTEQPGEVQEALSVLSRLVKPVCVGKEFVPIYEREQEFLAEMMDAGHVIPMSTGNLVGDQCHIYRGPLQGKTAYICRLDRHKRIAEMEVQLLGESRRVKVGLEIVRKE